MLTRYEASFLATLLASPFLFLEVLDEDETVALDEFAKLEQRLAHKDKDEPK